MFARSTFLLLLATLNQAASQGTPSQATYDYVIVGGGTAGLVLAERLSQNSSIRVAVIEAGIHYEVSNPIVSGSPGSDGLFTGANVTDSNPLVDWNFVTAPQAGANNRTIHYARGKCLGGSSARNFMVYQRGTRDSYQQWADAVGDQSYTFDNLLPYFKKSVTFTPPKTVATPPTPARAANASAQYDASAFSPSGSPLSVSYANFGGPFSSWMQPSLNEIGIPNVKDFNSGSLIGAQYVASTIEPTQERRESSETAYLPRSVIQRPNLDVFVATMAQKIIFDVTKKATAVKTNNFGIGASGVLFASKEIILSAGVFQSPQLLMLSGIGPMAALTKLGIPVIANRPGVGQNMTDHIFMGPSFRVNVETFSRISTDTPYLLGKVYPEYYANKTGQLTNPVCDFVGWEKTPRSLLSSSATSVLSQFPADWPELEYISAAGLIRDFANLAAQQPRDGYNYATILAAIVAPLSRGTVTLKSNNPNDLPIIDPRWLTDPTDVEVAIAGYKRARQAFASQAMQPVLLGNKTEYFPGTQVQTDDQILAVIRNTIMTVWHASCTCRMGKVSDPNAVVDSRARVIGVSGLRVVDASSFALLPPGHPQSTIYAIAEKISDDILYNKN